MNNVKLTTPLCTSKYLWIFKPNEKFGSEYSITCVRDDSLAWTKLIDTMYGMLEDYYAQQCALLKKKNLKKCIYYPWKEDADGNPIFVAKNKSEGMTKDGKKFTCKPMVVGPDGKVITEDNLKGSLGSGTQVRVGFTVNLWQNDAQGVGISARLSLVQIVVPKYFEPIAGFELDNTPVDPVLFNISPASSRPLTEDEYLRGLDIDDLLDNGKSAF
jgi:hypothetical protein